MYILFTVGGGSTDGALVTVSHCAGVVVPPLVTVATANYFYKIYKN